MKRLIKSLGLVFITGALSNCNPSFSPQNHRGDASAPQRDLPEIDRSRFQVLSEVTSDEKIKSMLDPRHPNFPTLRSSPREVIDSLEFVSPCSTQGCSVSHGGDHALDWHVVRAGPQGGKAYNIKFADPQCWEIYEWNSDYISIPVDNCWGNEDGYRYSRYADGRWLKRKWRPGDQIEAEYLVYAGYWDSCPDIPMGNGLKRTMTLAWRVKDFDWGAAGKLDTIALRQDYAGMQEFYFFAKGYGLIAWRMNHTGKTHLFNQKSNRKVIPVSTACAKVDGLATLPEVPVKNDPPVSEGSSATNVNQPAVPGNSDAPIPLASSPTSPQPTTCREKVLSSSYSFPKNLEWQSCHGKYSLVFQRDGNLVLYNLVTKSAIWSTSTGNSSADTAVLQADGNLVVWRSGVPLWNSNTGGNPGSDLVLRDDGSLFIRKGAVTLWSAGTKNK